MKDSFFTAWLQALATGALAALALAGPPVFGQSTLYTLTDANHGKAGYVDGNTFSTAQFRFPAGIALDPSGSLLFVADDTNNAIRMINKLGDRAASSTFTAFNSKNCISHPVALSVDSNTNIYVLNYANKTNGSLVVLNGFYYVNYGLRSVIATNATRLTNAVGLSLDGFNNAYITVKSNTVIRVTPAGVTTVVGVITNAKTSLRGLAFTSAGKLAITDAGNHGIWLMDPNNTNILHNAVKFTGFHGAGDTNGPAFLAAFNGPQNIIQAGNGILVVADRLNHKVKLVDPSGTVTRLFGVKGKYWTNPKGLGTLGWNDGTVNPIEAQDLVQSRMPYGLALAMDGTLYDTETYYDIVRKATGTGLTGVSPSVPPLFNHPAGIALDGSGNNLYIADQANNSVELLNLANNQTTQFLSITNGVNQPASVLLDTNQNVFVLNQNAGTNGSVLEFDPFGNLLATNITGLNLPTAFTMDGYGNLFIAEQTGKIRVLGSGVSNVLVTITNAGVSLQGIAIFDDGAIAVSDAGNHVVWSINAITKQYKRLTGQLGLPGNTLGSSNFAKLNLPHQLARAGGNQLVLADYGNNRLVTITRAGSVTNVLNSTNASVWFGQTGDPVANTSTRFPAMVQPSGVAVGSGGAVFTSETYFNDIRGLQSTGLTPPPVGPFDVLPYFNLPAGIAYDSYGNNLFVADPSQGAVQVLDLQSNLTTTFLSAADGLVQPVSVVVDTNENIFVLDQNGGANGFIAGYDIYGNWLGNVAAGLTQPNAFLQDGYGNFFVAEQGGAVRVFGAGISNTIVTITNAGVSLQGIALFDDGSIAVSDAGNQVIWSINSITKSYTRLTGKLGVPGSTLGSSNFAKLNLPHQLTRAANNLIVVADYGNNRLVTVSRSGSITNVLNSNNADVWFGLPGDPVLSTGPQFVPMVQPSGVAVGGGFVFASELFYDDIRGLIGSPVTAAAFNPGVPLPVFAQPAGIALNTVGNKLFIADPTNNTVNVLDLALNTTTPFLTESNGIYQPVDVALDGSDNLYVLNQGTGGNGSIYEFDQYGNLIATNAAGLPFPTAMKLKFNGDLYVAEQTGAVQLFSGGVSNTIATVNTNASVQLQGITILDNGAVVVSDAGNHVIWKIAPGSSNAVVFTGIIGTPGTTLGAANFAKLNTPLRLATALGGQLAIVDSGNNRVVIANDLGTVGTALSSTNANLWFGQAIDPVKPGNPNFVSMLSPVGIALSSAGTVYVSETTYKDIRGILNSGFYPLPPPPAAPLNLVATATYGQVSLTWSAALGATNYYVKRAQHTGGPYTTIGTTTGAGYVDTTVLGGTTYFYVVSGVNAGGEGYNSTEASATVPLPPVPDPQIGYVDFPASSVPVAYTAVFHQESSFVLNNDAPIVILGASGTQTYYTFGDSAGTVPDPTTNSSSAPVGYQNGMPESQVTIYDVNPHQPDVTIKALGAKNDGIPNSGIVSSRFQFVTANPTISGDNAAQFHISDVTANAHLYYTIDGSDPSVTNGIDLGTVATPTNLWVVGFPITSNTTFKVIAVRSHYQDSAIVSTIFSPSNFVANTISFGFANGEASSDFVASPGQMFYAPVTLTMLPNTTVFSLQFNLTATNSGPNPGPAITPGAFDFSSFLMQPDPANPGIYIPIPPFMFVADGTQPQPDSSSFLYNGNWFQSLMVTNLANNLLAVGWVERVTKTNLYNTKAQDLLTYSMAHDILHSGANGLIEVGGYAFQVPPTATNGQTYQIQIGRPSATDDGIGAPGSDVFIAAPTNNFGSGAPVSAMKYVTCGQRKYVAGSVYPFRWFNAGDFGSSNIVNADVEQVFQSAIYGLNAPPSDTDFFDGMDSCGATYVDLGHGYLEFNSYISGPSATDPLFDGNDTSINQIAFGDGVLDVCDVYVTFRRSLDPSLTWFRRYWANGQRVAEITPNIAAHVAVRTPAIAKVQSHATVAPQVNFTAADTGGAAGRRIQVPITADIFGSYPLRVLMLNLNVTPLDGAPALTNAVSFSQNVTLGTPVIRAATGNGNFSAAWLNNTNAGLTGTNVLLGTLSVTIPAGTPVNSTYAVHFDHASASPNGLASFPAQTTTGIITCTNNGVVNNVAKAAAKPALASPLDSSFGDGIPDLWRLRWFGTVHNLLSVSNACPSGDGISNWRKFIAGVNPLVANNFPKLQTKSAHQASAPSTIHWPSVAGKKYVIERSFNLFDDSWTAIATNNGTGTDLQFTDTNAAKVKFYRVQILP
jgi:DNA-binding beta-propeller fold protein YncE